MTVIPVQRIWKQADLWCSLISQKESWMDELKHCPENQNGKWLRNTLDICSSHDCTYTQEHLHMHTDKNIYTHHMCTENLSHYLFITNKQNTKPKRRDACFHVGPHFRSSKIAFQDALYLKSHNTPHSLLLHNRIWKTRFKT